MGGKDGHGDGAAAADAHSAQVVFNAPDGADVVLHAPLQLTGAELRVRINALQPAASIAALQLQVTAPVAIAPRPSDAAPPGGVHVPALVPVVHVDVEPALTYALHDGARIAVEYDGKPAAAAGVSVAEGVAGAAKAVAGLNSPSPLLAPPAPAPAQREVKAPAPPRAFRIRHVSSGKYVHVQGGVAGAKSGTRLVLHSGGESSRDTLFEWVAATIRVAAPVKAAAKPVQPAPQAGAAQAADGKVDAKADHKAPGQGSGPAGGAAAAATGVGGAAKGAGKSAPVPSTDDAPAPAVVIRTLRHVVTGLYVHPRDGVAVENAELVLWSTWNAPYALPVAMRAARLDLQPGSTANRDDDSGDPDVSEGRDGGPIQLTTHARNACVHPAGGLSGAAVADNTPLLWHKPGASPVTTFVLQTDVPARK